LLLSAGTCSGQSIAAADDGTQQQNRRPPLLLLIDGTERWTDGWMDA